MITLFTGSYQEMSPLQQAAVHELTVNRYVKDIFKLETFLQENLHLQNNTVQYEVEYESYYRKISDILAPAPQSTYVSALFVVNDSKPIVMSALRIVCGTGTDRPISKTIGNPESSIPTHQLLEGFRYPSWPGWNPDEIAEAQIVEPSKLVKLDKKDLIGLVHSGYLTQAEVEFVLSFSFVGIFSSLHRLIQQVIPDLAGYVMNTYPLLATILRREYHLEWLPLPSQSGIFPTSLARSHENPASIYFNHQITGFKELFSTQPREWSLENPDIGKTTVTLPFLLVNDESLEAAIRGLEKEPLPSSFVKMDSRGLRFPAD